MALIDDPKVQNLVDKAAAKAAKTQLKQDVDLVKDMFANIDFADMDKSPAKFINSLSRDLVRELKAASKGE